MVYLGKTETLTHNPNGDVNTLGEVEGVPTRRKGKINTKTKGVHKLGGGGGYKTKKGTGGGYGKGRKS